jgi:hypothetical protein
VPLLPLQPTVAWSGNEEAKISMLLQTYVHSIIKASDILRIPQLSGSSGNKAP